MFKNTYIFRPFKVPCPLKATSSRAEKLHTKQLCSAIITIISYWFALCSRGCDTDDNVQYMQDNEEIRSYEWRRGIADADNRFIAIDFDIAFMK